MIGLYTHIVQGCQLGDDHYDEFFHGFFQGPCLSKDFFSWLWHSGQGQIQFWFLTATTQPTSEQRRACIQGTISWFFWGVVEEIVFNIFVSEQIGGHLLLYLILLFPLNTHTHILHSVKNPLHFRILSQEAPNRLHCYAWRRKTQIEV